jgi:polyisoprenoid-binding protein YceI
MKFTQVIARSVVVASLSLMTNWNVDSAKAKIIFTVKGPFGVVHGSFSGLKAEIKFDEKDLAGSSISASVDAKTVNTGIGLRNHDLRSKEEWLNTDKFPRISYHAKKIEKAGTAYKAMGELTLKGVTKPAGISFTFTPHDGSSGLFKGDLKINREEFNVGKKGGSVGGDISITLEVPVKK